MRRLIRWVSAGGIGRAAATRGGATMAWTTTSLAPEKRCSVRFTPRSSSRSWISRTWSSRCSARAGGGKEFDRGQRGGLPRVGRFDFRHVAQLDYGPDRVALGPQPQFGRLCTMRAEERR